jgi:hypothetical protein
VFVEAVLVERAADADERIATYEAREAEYEVKAREADPRHWAAKAEAARQSREQLESDLQGARREATMKLASLGPKVVEAQERYIEAINTFTSEIGAYLAWTEDFELAKAKARRLGADIPTDLPDTLSTRMTRLSERPLHNLILGARAAGIPT